MPSLARADGLREAEEEMRKAKLAMDRRDYETAVGHYLVARSLAPETTGPYLGLGLAHAALGRCAEAIPVLEEYLRRKPSSPHPSALATLAACRQGRAQAPPPAPAPEPVPAPPPRSTPTPPPSPPPATRGDVVPVGTAKGKIHLEIGPVGAEVTINGTRESGVRRDLEVSVPSGIYTVVIERRGYDTVTHELWVRADTTTEDKVTLVETGPREAKHRAGIALGVILAAGAVAAAISIGVIYGTPAPTPRFTAVVNP